ncbi:MAG: molybdopterin-binding protein [Clostridia bacterium]|nr:molybdopterin-binding protein [Clostridia bacterium]MDD4146038.1 molybdopterin-binding protein [Clostridia bacterium]MDD4666092.1 molybdopterin-binding protein [Clostridia bacterium]
MGQIVAVCTSKHKGEQKKEVGSAMLVKDLGLAGDAHAGFAHRQVSLLALESIQKMREKGLALRPGSFAENLTTEGLELFTIPIGTRLKVGQDVLLRVTQIGKECHHHCEVYQKVGDCVMPREGIFTEVLQGGKVCAGDDLEIYPSARFAVITVSDKGARGEREDRSGPLIAEMLLPWGDVSGAFIVPDEVTAIEKLLIKLADEGKADIIFTTGGTGLSSRDVTPEATRKVIEREVPGIPEAMRWASLQVVPQTMLSRAIAGIRGQTLIINLPGSPKAVKENLAVFLEVIAHALEILTGRGSECGKE